MTGNKKQRYASSMQDIARESETSIATVSRVLKDDPRISGKTRERVLQAARKLGYVANRLVTGLRGEGTRMIGVSCGMDEYLASVYQQIVHCLWDERYVPLNLAPRPSAGGGDEQAVLQAFIERRVDGIIARPVMYAKVACVYEELRERGIPLVLIDCDIPDARIPFCGTDDFSGGRMAADYLIARGHRVLGHLPGYRLSHAGALREQGFLAGAQAGGARVVVAEDECGFSCQPEAAKKLLTGRRRPTAIFAANDTGACGAYRAAAELGLRIPEDLAVIGFGNLTVGAQLQPALTTFCQHPELIARQAVDMVLQQISDGDFRPSHSLVSPQLLQRESV